MKYIEYIWYKNRICAHKGYKGLRLNAADFERE